MRDTKYTFCLPAYKVKFLAEALNSIRGQTFTDFTCIVSDDCSPENIKEVFDKTVGDDSRFVYRRNEKNMGSKSLVSHWNLLVDMCDTEYLIMASDDDVYDIGFLHGVESMSEKYPEANLIRSRVRMINEEGKTLFYDAIYEEYVDNQHFFRQTFASNSISCEANYCYKTDVLRNNGGFVVFPTAWFSDDATHLLMAKHGCVNTKDLLFSYRMSDISISNTWGDADDSCKKVEASLLFWKWVHGYIMDMDCRTEPWLMKMALTDCKRKLIRNIENNLQHCSCRDFVRLLNRSNMEIGISKVTSMYNWLRVHLH
ncbi:glycosyltransferase [Palleniella muris]|uniref:Glycosyltransferase n=1 Tax=Palleniella muris TaxID=3038145 RepID=A0AC61QMD7_9BACT|nr:glycosyltransferase [Palleniella muris]TGX80310.1 glycosyltransferase [Palleniella muris]